MRVQVGQLEGFSRPDQVLGQVRAHLQSILRKPGFRSRVQIAARVLRART